MATNVDLTSRNMAGSDSSRRSARTPATRQPALRASAPMRTAESGFDSSAHSISRGNTVIRNVVSEPASP